MATGREGARLRSEQSGVFLSQPAVTILAALRSAGDVRSSEVGRLTGLEAANQVRGTAGDYQVDGAQVALGHAYGGAAQYFAMWIVSSELNPEFR